MKYTFFEYPFQFNECILTQSLLDALGFTDYWGGCGDYGTRRLILNHKIYKITIQDELEDGSYGYGAKQYNPEIMYSDTSKNNIYFLHDMYDDIFENLGPKAALDFEYKCDKCGLSIDIQSYLRFREQYIDEAYYNEFIKNKDEERD